MTSRPVFDARERGNNRNPTKPNKAVANIAPETPAISPIASARITPIAEPIKFAA